MNEYEEINSYCLHQINDMENSILLDEPKEQEYSEERENNIINNEIKSIDIKAKISKSTSKRLRTFPKNYQTYSMDFKKKVLKEVNIDFIIIINFKL